MTCLPIPILDAWKRVIADNVQPSAFREFYDYGGRARSFRTGRQACNNKFLKNRRFRNWRKIRGLKSSSM